MGYALAIAAALAAASQAEWPRRRDARSGAYGTTQGGQAVDIFTMTNDHGLRVRFLSFGGVITEIDVPDRTGRSTTSSSASGPCRNTRRSARITARSPAAMPTALPARSSRWDGQTYHLIANNGANTLHGGPNALDAGLGGVSHAGARRRRRDAQLCQQGRRPELSRHIDDACDLHADQRQRAADRLRRPPPTRTRWSTSPTIPTSTWPATAGFGRGSAAAGNADRYTPSRARSDSHWRDRTVEGTPSTSGR